MADKLEVTAQPLRPWAVRGETTRVAEASPDVQLKVKEGLKAALQAQLATEMRTLGNLGERLTIHGRTGVSNITDMESMDPVNPI